MNSILRDQWEAVRRTLDPNNPVRKAVAPEFLPEPIELPPFEVLEIGEQLHRELLQPLDAGF